MAWISKYSVLRRFHFEALYNSYLSLEPRQQTTTLIGLGVFLLILVGLPLSLAGSKLGSLQEQVVKGKERQREISRRLEDYRQLKDELKKMESKISGGFDSTITTTMATLAGESQIKGRIENIRDRGATSMELFDKISVEVKLTKVTVPQLIDYLYKIEHHPNLFIQVGPLTIKRRFDNRQLLDVMFQASTYRLQAVGS